MQQEMNIFAFQDHIRSRIHKQAKLVEKHWLGSASQITEEFETTLSEVWLLLRDDMFSEIDRLPYVVYA